MTTSGTTSFGLSGADIVLEAFDRIGVRPPEITADHMVSARRSLNLVQARWANRGTNLWKVSPAQAPLSLPLLQGVASYALPASTIMLLDCYLRSFPMGQPVNLAPAFSTTSGSPTVEIYQPNHGLAVGGYVNIIVPIAIGGLLLQGFYAAASVIDSAHFTIAAAANATSTAGPGGAVPAFTTTQGSASVAVALANHGLLPGETFTVEVPTTVGGLALSGGYVVGSVGDANDFTITAPSPATASASAAENGGLAQLADQVQSSDPLDRILTPISRSDYAALPDKLQQAPPTVYYFDRQSAQPTMTLWQVPDGNGPYEFLAFTASQLQDANALASQSPDVPYRFLEALCADLAYALARKYPPNPQSGIAIADLKLAAAEAWEEAAQEDRERVPLFLVPDMSGYFR